MPFAHFPGFFDIFRFDGAGSDDDGIDFLFSGEEVEVCDIAQDFLSVNVFIPEAGVVVQESDNAGGGKFDITFNLL